MKTDTGLPEPLPDSPLEIFARWLDEARTRRLQPNPDSMVIATVGPDGTPAARVVLCKHLATDPGFVVFYTNYLSRKGRELTVNPRAAAVLHWDALGRQVRIEGPVTRSPVEESDRYFASRPLDSRIGAWASRQSEPLATRAALAAQVREVMTRFGIADDARDADIPRPPHWGGYRLWIETLELWIAGPGRVHERAVWRRTLEPWGEDALRGGPWTATRLNP